MTYHLFALFSLVLTNDPSTSVNTIFLFHRENGLDAGIRASASTSSRIKIFSFSLVLALMLGFALQQAKTKHQLNRHNTSIIKRIFTTSGRVWPMKALDPDYLTNEQFF